MCCPNNTPKGQSKMDNPEKLATYGTQDEEKQNNKHNTICVGNQCAQTSINSVNKTRAPYKQLEVKTNRTSFSCGNRSGHHNTEFRT